MAVPRVTWRGTLPTFFITGGGFEGIKHGCVHWTGFVDEIQPSGLVVRRQVLRTICPENHLRAINVDMTDLLRRGAH